MNCWLPPEIEVYELPDGVCYRLPRRTWPVRSIGMRMAHVLLLIETLAVVMLATGLMEEIVARGAPGLVWAVPWVAALAILDIAALAIPSLFLWQGTTDIELRDGRLMAVERLGRFHWTRFCDVAAIERIAVRPWPTRLPGHQDQLTSAGQQPMCLDAVGGGRPLRLVVAYPLGWLSLLAEDLEQRCRQEFGMPTPISGESARSDSWPDAPQRPPGSRAVVKRTHDGAQAIVSGREHGLLEKMGLCLALEGLPMVVAGTGVLLMQPGAPFMVWLSMAVMWLGVTVPGLRVLRSLRARILLTASAEGLTVVRRGLLFAWQRSWPARTISIIWALHPRSRRRSLGVGLGTGQDVIVLEDGDPSELQWLAAVLRQAFHLPEQQSPLSAEPGRQARARWPEVRDRTLGGLVGHHLAIMLQSPAKTATYLTESDWKYRFAALQLLEDHWKFGEALESVFRELARRDPDMPVRRMALMCLGSMYSGTKNRAICRMLAGIVRNPDEDLRVREQAYRDLFRLCGISALEWPPIQNFDLLRDAKWDWVDSFLKRPSWLQRFLAGGAGGEKDATS